MTEDYWGHHRAPSGADDVAAPMHDVEEMMPDYYDRPNLYSHDRGPVDRECERAIKAVRGKPDAMVTIYRALPPGNTTINTGDWVTPSLTYARGHAMQTDDPSQDWPVISVQVPAKTLWTEGYAAEWGYSGPRINARLAKKIAVREVVADQDYSDYVMLALRPSEATRKVYADMDECTEDVDDLHLTLYYLGTTEDAGGEWGRERLYRGCYDFAIHSGYRGMTGVANGFGCFMNDDTNVLISLWDIPGIAEFRTLLMDTVKTHGFRPRQEDHGFTPHMSLAYDEDKPFLTLPRLPEGNPDKEVFTSIWLVWGKEWTEVTLA